MENLKRQFVNESKKDLAELIENLQNAEVITDELRREFLRTLHTIKGTSQTFGFAKSAFLAHSLENLFSRSKDGNDSDKKTFVDGLNFLQSSLKQGDFEIPENYLKKTYSTFPKHARRKDFTEHLISEIPAEFTGFLSNKEKNSLASALENGKNIFCLEADFDLKNFAETVRFFRANLEENGEVIAALSSPKTNLQNKIGFRFLFAASADTAKIEQIIKPFSAEVIYRKVPKNSPDNLQGILDEITAHAEEIAEKSGKKIEFEIFTDKVEIPAEKLRIIFEILLHLVRNAVDHAIETAEKRIIGGKNECGQIKISLKKVKENDLLLTIADDGNGIDLKKIKAKAIEQNIISESEVLSEKATLELIFQSELSTAAEINEISGRGVGLDAARNAVEESGGKISVESENGKGTRFEILLPKFF